MCWSNPLRAPCHFRGEEGAGDTASAARLEPASELRSSKLCSDRTGKLGTRRVATLGGSSASHAKHNCDCLLYTSDAADDM
eukprot:429516-Alexandrium_andersonii.AAC.1